MSTLCLKTQSNTRRVKIVQINDILIGQYTTVTLKSHVIVITLKKNQSYMHVYCGF